MAFWRTPFDSDEMQVTRGIVHIIKERCKGCGYCIAYCPRNVLKASREFNSNGYHFPEVKNQECLNCDYCQLLCPEFAIFSTEASDENQ